MLLCPTDAVFSLLTPLMCHVGLSHTQDTGFHKMALSSVKVNSCVFKSSFHMGAVPIGSRAFIGVNRCHETRSWCMLDTSTP